MILRTADYQQSFFCLIQDRDLPDSLQECMHISESACIRPLAILFAENRLSRLNSRLKQFINDIHQMMF